MYPRLKGCKEDSQILELNPEATWQSMHTNNNMTFAHWTSCSF